MQIRCQRAASQVWGFKAKYTTIPVCWNRCSAFLPSGGGVISGFTKKNWSAECWNVASLLGKNWEDNQKQQVGIFLPQHHSCSAGYYITTHTELQLLVLSNFRAFLNNTSHDESLIWFCHRTDEKNRREDMADHLLLCCGQLNSKCV